MSDATSDSIVAPAQTAVWDTTVLGYGEAIVDVGGHRLSVGCAGTGSPTVIIEAGAGGSKGSWRYVQHLLAAETRACAYSRAGLGKSDQPPPEDVLVEGLLGENHLQVTTPQSTIDDLSALLEAAQIGPPYVLVGHSLGGIYIRLFADQYPDLVAGMVFLDSTHPSPERFLDLPVPGGLDEFADLFRKALQSVAGSAADTGPFADVPIAVVSADPDVRIWQMLQSGTPEETANALAAAMTEQQEDLANLSTNSTSLVVEGAAHSSIHRTNSQAVGDAILDVVRKARATSGS